MSDYLDGSVVVALHCNAAQWPERSAVPVFTCSNTVVWYSAGICTDVSGLHSAIDMARAVQQMASSLFHYNLNLVQFSRSKKNIFLIKWSRFLSAPSNINPKCKHIYWVIYLSFWFILTHVSPILHFTFSAKASGCCCQISRRRDRKQVLSHTVCRALHINYQLNHNRISLNIDFLFLSLSADHPSPWKQSTPPTGLMLTPHRMEVTDYKARTSHTNAAAGLRQSQK